MHQQINQLHDWAMERVDCALAAGRSGKTDEAHTAFQQAFHLERTGAELVLTLTNQPEPTRSVLLRSAATLALDCGRFEEAVRLSSLGLDADAPQEIAAELSDVFEKAGSELAKYEAIPTGPATIVYEQLTLANGYVAARRDEALFKDDLASVLHALQFGSETPRLDPVETTCREVGRVALYLTRELIGDGRKTLIWRTCDRLLRFYAIQLEYSLDSVDELWDLLNIDQISHGEVSKLLINLSEPLRRESSPNTELSPE
ncbi:MAG: hypothetical protein AAGD07_24000 [Planctomycetota bacterium]